MSFWETKAEWETLRKCFAGRMLSVGEGSGGPEPGGALRGVEREQHRRRGQVLGVSRCPAPQAKWLPSARAGLHRRGTETCRQPAVAVSGAAGTATEVDLGRTPHTRPPATETGHSFAVQLRPAPSSAQAPGQRCPQRPPLLLRLCRASWPLRPMPSALPWAPR